MFEIGENKEGKINYQADVCFPKQGFKNKQIISASSDALIPILGLVCRGNESLCNDHSIFSLIMALFFIVFEIGFCKQITRLLECVICEWSF